MVTEVGGKPVNHREANTLPFQEAVNHLRGAVMAQLSPDCHQKGERGWAGGLEKAEAEKKYDLVNWKETSSDA